MSETAVVERLTKAYRSSVGEVEALRGVDARFAAGRLTAVVGPSGSGKSTLLRVLAGLERPTSGEVRVGGRELAGLSARGLRSHRRDGVTFVSQSPADNFLPQLTLAEQLASAGDLARGRELLERFGVADRAGELPRSLSGGEQARAAMALALLRRAPLVVCDEPTAELDEGSAARLLEAMRAATADGVAFVVATHDDDVVAISDSVLRLERGRVVEAGARSAGKTAAPRPTPSGSAVVVAEAVRKTYGHVHAVDGVDLALGRGALGALVGRSGSGKSTLLALLGGWTEPDAGRVAIDGSDPRTLPWRRLAYLPQRFGLVPELTVRGNVELPLRLADGADRSDVDRLLVLLGLDELAGRLPHETSIGQQQRTALARALALGPAVLLADEPTSHQDVGWRDRVVEVLREACAAGTTCLIATHEPLVASRADATWHLADGHAV